MNIKNTLTLLVVLISGQYLSGQQTVFSYDDNGNRTSRIIQVNKVTYDSTGFVDTTNSKLNNKILANNIVSLSGEDLDGIQIFPNPNKGVFQIIINGWDSSIKTELEIISTEGNRIYQKLINNSVTDIDLRKYPSGLYILSLSNKQMNRRWKILKE